MTNKQRDKIYAAAKKAASFANSIAGMASYEFPSEIRMGIAAQELLARAEEIEEAISEEG